MFRNSGSVLALTLGTTVVACGREAPSVDGQWKYAASYTFPDPPGQPSCFLTGVLALEADGTLLQGSLSATERCSDDYQDSVQVAVPLTGVLVPYGADAWTIALDAADNSMDHFGYVTDTDISGWVRFSGRYGLADWSWWACKPPPDVDLAVFYCSQQRPPPNKR